MSFCCYTIAPLARIETIHNLPPFYDEAPNLDKTLTNIEGVVVSVPGDYTMDTENENDAEMVISKGTNRNGFMQPDLDGCEWAGVNVW